jgi:tellurium resistance protein TerZ
MAISLSKGQKIDLTKSTGESLTNFCVGVNWGAILTEKKSFWGSTKKEVQDVDLDLSCVLTDSSGEIVDYIYSPDYNSFLKKNNLPLGKLTTNDGALKHSGDDRKGDFDGDDGLDNEIISVDLNKVASNVDKIFFFLNIYLNQGQSFDFSDVPYAKIRMYEGTIKRVNTVFANYDIATNSSFSGKGALVLGKLYRRNNVWRFDAIGDPTNDKMLLQTLTNILNNYAK